MTRLKRDPRSIWNKSRNASKLTRADLQVIVNSVQRSQDFIFECVDSDIDDIRNTMESLADQHDLGSLERHVNDIESRVDDLESDF